MGNRGSKSDSYLSVKEQRVDGSYLGQPRLKCTLMGFERSCSLLRDVLASLQKTCL
jgi:hypothetical protein